LAFAVPEFPRLAPWLMLNRGGLSILVHPLTGDDYEDHSRFALRLGEKLALDLESLRRPVEWSTHALNVAFGSLNHVHADASNTAHSSLVLDMLPAGLAGA
jgi:Dopa 4,5-dioxygenase family